MHIIQKLFIFPFVEQSVLKYFFYNYISLTCRLLRPHWFVCCCFNTNSLTENCSEISLASNWPILYAISKTPDTATPYMSDVPLTESLGTGRNSLRTGSVRRYLNRTTFVHFNWRPKNCTRNANYHLQCTMIYMYWYLQIIITMKSSVGNETFKSYFSSIMHWIFFYYCTVHVRWMHFHSKIKHHFLLLSIFSFKVKQSTIELINFKVKQKTKSKIYIRLSNTSFL